MIETLRNEIIESQKARTLLLERKLIIVATIGAIGLGTSVNFGDSSSGHRDLKIILCLIPFVCFYVDLLCKHLQMRMLVIGKYFRDIFIKNQASENINDKITQIGEYEVFCNKLRDNDGRGIFGLEDWAQEGSTVLLSSLLVVYGLVHAGIKFYYHDLDFQEILYVLAFFISGFFGILITRVLKKYYQRKVQRVDHDK